MSKQKWFRNWNFPWSKPKEEVVQPVVAPKKTRLDMNVSELIADGVPVVIHGEERAKFHDGQTVSIKYREGYGLVEKSVEAKIIKVRSYADDRLLLEYKDGSRYWKASVNDGYDIVDVIEIARRWHHSYLVETPDHARRWIHNLEDVTITEANAA